MKRNTILALVLALAGSLGAMLFSAPTAAQQRAWMGVSLDPLSFTELEEMGLEYGVRIDQVSEAGPAADAGLKPGDVMVSLNHKPVFSMRRLQWLIGNLEPGDQVTVNYRRNGEAKEVTLTLGGRQYGQPRAGRPGYGSGYLGVLFQPLTPQLAEYFGVGEEAKGMLVTEVEKGGAAEQAGINVGDVVVRMDRKTIYHMGDVYRVLNFFDAGDELEITLIRQGEEITRTVTLGERQHEDWMGPGPRFKPHMQGYGVPFEGHPYHPARPGY